MSSIWTSLFSCCGSTHSEETDNSERTALLNPDFLPEAPVQIIGKSTEDQLAEQDALRSIFTEAAERFVDIESPSPFSRPQSSPYSSRSVSPVSYDNHLHPNSTKQSQLRSSTWRANIETPVKVIHLGTHFEPHASTSNRNGIGYHDRAVNGGGMRPPSSHSLKTLTKGSGGARGRPSPLSTRIGSTVERGERRESSASGESLYGTMTSYKTAREGDGTIIEGAFRSGEGDARTSLKDICSRDGESNIADDVSDEEEIGRDDYRRAEAIQRILLREEELATAIKVLENSMEDFEITVTEPLVFNLGGERS